MKRPEKGFGSGAFFAPGPVREVDPSAEGFLGRACACLPMPALLSQRKIRFKTKEVSKPKSTCVFAGIVGPALGWSTRRSILDAGSCLEPKAKFLCARR